MKAEEKKALVDKAARKGKNSIMNGRALFTFNKEIFKDDENAADIEFEDEEEKTEEGKAGAKKKNKKADAVADKDLFAKE